MWWLLVDSFFCQPKSKKFECTVSIKERCPVELNVKRAKTPLQLGMRQKLIIPSCLSWKVVTFFGKEHVNWSSISGVMIGRSWTIKFGKFHYLVCYCFSNFDFSTPLFLDQLTCSLPKNVTTFCGEQDGIIHLGLSPYKRGVLAP